MRVRRLLEVQRTRMQISRDLHDEISASMSGIASFARAIRTDGGNRFTPGSRKFLSLIATSADEAQEAVGDIIWSLNPENDPWEAMLPKLRRFASDLLESKKIAYSIDIPRTLAVKNLDTQRRRDFWLAYKEMVTNAVRHSQCTEARISIDVVGDREIRLVVRDNGKGFDPSAFGGRHGLRNIQARARQLGGTATVKTGAGLGTRWELRAPV